MANTNLKEWVGDFYVEVEEPLKKYVAGNLRRNLHSKFGPDVVQEAFRKLLDELEHGKLRWIDESNWRHPVPLAALKGWTFNTVKFSNYDMIRNSEKYDHGTEGLENIPAVPTSPCVVGETAERVVATVRQRPPRDQRVMLRSAFDGVSDEELADELGVDQGTVRVIRHRVRKWLKSQLAEKPNALQTAR